MWLGQGLGRVVQGEEEVAEDGGIRDRCPGRCRRVIVGEMFAGSAMIGRGGHRHRVEGGLARQTGDPERMWRRWSCAGNYDGFYKISLMWSFQVRVCEEWKVNEDEEWMGLE